MSKRLATGAMEEKVATKEMVENTTSFLERVSIILLSLSKGNDSISEISKQCGTSLSTTHRILHALKKPGFSLYDDINRRYYLGPLITQLSSSFQINHRSLFLCALPDMQRLSEATGEVISMRVMVGMQSFQLHEIPATHNISVNLNPPAIEPIIPTGPINRLFLASLNDKDLLDTIKSYVISLDGSPLSDIESIISDIKRVRQQGYALSTGHRFAGITVIAVPVENYGFPVALCIVGLDNRIAARRGEIISLLKNRAETISSHLKDISGK
jgi:IclR family transcriptional regulator, acetate operon repressor